MAMTKLERIEKKVASGKTIREAAEELGIPLSSAYSLTSKGRREPKVVTYSGKTRSKTKKRTAGGEVSAEAVVAFIGQPSVVSRMVSEYMGGAQ